MLNWVTIKWKGFIYNGSGSVQSGTGRCLVVLGQSKPVLVGTWWNWVSRRRYCLVLGVTVSVWGVTSWYLVVLGQYNMAPLGVKWYWVIIGLLCLYILQKYDDLVRCHHSRTDND